MNDTSTGTSPVYVVIVFHLVKQSTKPLGFLFYMYDQVCAATILCFLHYAIYFLLYFLCNISVPVFLPMDTESEINSKQTNKKYSVETIDQYGGLFRPSNI